MIYLGGVGFIIAHASRYLCHTLKHYMIMATISTTDILYATVSQRGTTVATLTLSGVSSLSEIISRIKEVVKGTLGLFTLNLRNSSQGWREQRNILLKPSPKVVQLTLF